jgi:hypothetical protein
LIKSDGVSLTRLLLIYKKHKQPVGMKASLKESVAARGK